MLEYLIVLCVIFSGSSVACHAESDTNIFRNVGRYGFCSNFNFSVFSRWWDC